MAEPRASRRARRHARVPFAALRATWTGREPAVILETAADHLLAMLRADVVLVRPNGLSSGAQARVLRTAGDPLPTDRARKVTNMLESVLGAVGHGKPRRVANPLRPGTLAVAVSPLGCGSEFGALLVGSRQRGFPDPMQRALLELAAAQLSLTLKEHQLAERERADQARRERDELFRATFAHASVGIAVMTPAGRFVQVNQAYCDITGYTEAELLATDFQSITHPDDRAESLAVLHRIRSEVFPGFVFEKRYIRRDGGVIWVRLSVACVRDAGGGIRNLVAIAQDVTAHKRAEAALRESDRRFTAVFESATDGMLIADDDGCCIDANPAACAILGRAREQVQGRSLAEFSASAPKHAQAWQAFLSAQRASGEWRVVRPDGANRELEYAASADFLPGLHLAVLRDITERKTVHADLRRKSELLQSLFDNIPVMIAFPDRSGRVTWANRAWERVHGWSSSELKDLDLMAELFPDPAERAEVVEFVGTVPPPGWREFRVRVRDGRMVDTAWANVVLSDGSIVGIGQDVTERKRAECALRESERQFRAAFDGALDGIVVLDDERRFVDANPATCAFFGLSRTDLLSRRPGELSAPGQDPDAAWETFRRTGRLECTWRFLRSDGAVREAEITAVAHFVPGRHVAVFRDVTERKRAEEALRMAEERYRSVFENAVVGMFQTTPEGRYIAANGELARMYGFDSPREFIDAVTDIGRQLYVDPSLRAEFAWLLHERGTVSRFESEVYRKDGSRFWISVSARAVADASGVVRHYEGVVEDVTDLRQAERSLRASEERYRLLFERSPLPMWVVDAESFAFLAVNDAAVRHYGYSRGEFLAMTASDVRPPEEVPRFMEHAAKAPTGLTQAGIRRHRKKDGSVMDVEVASDELVFEGRNAWLVVLNDVTERERTNDALQARIRQQAAVADLGQRALEVADLPSLLSDAAVVVSRTLGVDLCGIFEQSPDRRELVLRAGVGWPAEMIGRARIGAGSGSQGGFTLLAGEPVILEDLATEARFSPSRLLTDHGVVSGVSVAIPGGDQPFGVLEAHTTRRRVFTTDDVHFLRAIANVLAAAILRRREDDVRRQLLERVMWAQEDERRRIALELHDETGQALASLLVGLRAVADEPSLPKVKGQTERLRWLVAGTMDGLSRLARGLHPTVLRDLGLVPALSRYAAEHGQLLGISIAVDAEGVDGQRLTPAVEISLYRIAQEALANVGKHASARHARVLLRREDSTVRLVVEDDGEGFAVGEVLRSAVRSGHLGLHGIRERAAVLGGRAEIDSSPGRGTRVSVSVPLTSVSRGRRKRAASR